MVFWLILTVLLKSIPFCQFLSKLDSNLKTCILQFNQVLVQCWLLKIFKARYHKFCTNLYTCEFQQRFLTYTFSLVSNLLNCVVVKLVFSPHEPIKLYQNQIKFKFNLKIRWIFNLSVIFFLFAISSSLSKKQNNKESCLEFFYINALLDLMGRIRYGPIYFFCLEHTKCKLIFHL